MITYFLDSEWSSPYEGYMCALTRSETYTYDLNNHCNGWKADIDTCKEYCKNNKLPSSCTLWNSYYYSKNSLPVCTHVIWHKQHKWCHLAKACTLKTNSAYVVIKNLKRGIV